MWHCRAVAQSVSLLANPTAVETEQVQAAKVLALRCDPDAHPRDWRLARGYAVNLGAVRAGVALLSGSELSTGVMKVAAWELLMVLAFGSETLAADLANNAAVHTAALQDIVVPQRASRSCGLDLCESALLCLGVLACDGGDRARRGLLPLTRKVIVAVRVGGVSATAAAFLLGAIARSPRLHTPLRALGVVGPLVANALALYDTSNMGCDVSVLLASSFCRCRLQGCGGGCGNSRLACGALLLRLAGGDEGEHAVDQLLDFGFLQEYALPFLHAALSRTTAPDGHRKPPVALAIDLFAGLAGSGQRAERCVAAGVVEPLVVALCTSSGGQPVVDEGCLRALEVLSTLARYPGACCMEISRTLGCVGLSHLIELERSTVTVLRRRGGGPAVRAYTVSAREMAAKVLCVARGMGRAEVMEALYAASSTLLDSAGGKRPERCANPYACLTGSPNGGAGSTSAFPLSCLRAVMEETSRAAAEWERAAALEHIIVATLVQCERSFVTDRGAQR